MANYDYARKAPWASSEYKDQVHTVRFYLTGDLRIGNYAFYDCTSLETVSYQKQGGSPHITIGELAFYWCTSLTNVPLLAGDVVTTIGPGAFWGCTSLASLTIGNSVTSIGHDAFYICTSLTSITFTSQTWNITLESLAFSLGTSEHPVTCIVVSPDNMADGRLDAY